MIAGILILNDDLNDQIAESRENNYTTIYFNGNTGSVKSEIVSSNTMEINCKKEDKTKTMRKSK